MTKANTQEWNVRQTRFLSAYRDLPEISRAARLAHVHRATVYRWMNDAGFSEKLKTIRDAFYREHRAKVLADEANRRQWRQERERARNPLRCYYLALAREAK